MTKLLTEFSKLTNEQKKEFEISFFNNALIKNNSETKFLVLYNNSFAYEQKEFLNLEFYTSKNKEYFSKNSILNSFLNDKQRSDIMDFHSIFENSSHKDMIDTAEKLLANRSYSHLLKRSDFFNSLDDKTLLFIINKDKLQSHLSQKVQNELKSREQLINLFADFEKASIFKKFKIKKQENEKTPFLLNSVTNSIMLNYKTTTPLDYAIAKREVQLVAFLTEKGHSSFKTTDAITRALTLSLLDRNQEMFSYIYNNHNNKIDYTHTRDLRDSSGKNLITASLINYVKTRDNDSFNIFKSISEQSPPDINDLESVIMDINKLAFFKQNKAEHLQVLYNVADIALKHNFDKKIHRSIGQSITDIMYKDTSVNSDEIKKIHQIVQLFHHSYGQDSVYCKSVANQLSNRFLARTDLLANKESLKIKLNKDIDETPDLKRNLVSK